MQARSLLGKAKQVLRESQSSFPVSHGRFSHPDDVLGAAVDSLACVSGTPESSFQPRDRRCKSLQQLILPEEAEALSQDDEEEGLDLCAICMECVPDTVFVPCGHAVSCSACADKVLRRTAECPMCRCHLSGTQSIAEACSSLQCLHIQ